MSLTADQIVDRRSLRRRLSFWRVVAFVAIALGIVAAIVLSAGRDGLAGLVTPQIARVSISGFITDDRDQIELLDRIGKADAVKGVIVAIDSTGGATAGGEALYEALLRLSAKKPTVATMGTVGASAAYMAAIATNHVIARRTTITGSIGVIFQYPEVSQLLDKVGVGIEEVKSSPLKAEPSPFRPATPEALAVIGSIVRDTYDWFVDIVAERRGLERERRADPRRRAHLHRPPGARRETDRRDRRRGAGARLARHEGRRPQAARSATGSRRTGAAGSFPPTSRCSGSPASSA